MKKQLIIFLAAMLVIAFACQKELSFESPNTPAKGSLKDDAAGDCLPQTVNGIYVATTPLVPATNTITVQVDVATAGSYTIYTDTVNGYFFRTTGIFTTTGLNNVTLRSSGTPFAAGVDNFVVYFDTSFCDIAVTVLPAGSGAAVFTENCAGATVNGTYTSGVALTASNTITIPITLTTPGSYTLTGTVNGMTFSSSGALLAGATSITLNGSGTPTAAGTFNLTVGSCTIPITVIAGGGAAVYTLNCGTATVNGTYTSGVALTASNTITIPITLTTPGTYTLTGTINGMTFSNSGTLTAGTTSITLNGTGTPTTSGTFNLTVGSCTIPITVIAGAGAAVYTINCGGVTVNGTYTAGVALTASNTITIPITLTTPGTYTLTGTINGMTFSNSGTLTAGTTSITLNGTGTPTASGTFNLSIGTPPCSIPITCNAAPVIDYYPRTTNSNWSYEFDDVPTDSVLRFVIAATKTVNGNVFNIFMKNDGVTPPPDSSGYYRKNGGDYIEWFDWAAFIGGLDFSVWTEYTMLKDNVAVGTIWKTGTSNVASGGTPIGLRFSYKILQKDVPISVTTSTGTVNYTNVIVVEEKIDYSTNGGTTWQDATTVLDYYGKSYYARNIGLILFEAYDASSVLQFKQELRRSQVF